MPDLTIAIPTFARNAKLLRTVAALMPQLNHRCRLVVLDNHSPVAAAETLYDVLSSYPAADCTIMRHRINIGGNANIMRCFEICETPWLWVLGDDDTVDPAAIATIFETIDVDPELIYVNYGPPGDGRKHTTITTGQEEFARAIDVFTHSNFISACLYNHARIGSRLSHGMQYAYSCAPHTLMVLLSIGSSGRCLFSEKKIAHWAPAEPGQHGDLVAAWLGFPLLLEAQLPSSVRRLMAHAIFKERPPLRAFARELYYAGERTQDFATSRFLYDHLMFRLSYFDPSIRAFLTAWIGRLPLIFPRTFDVVNRWSAKLTGRQINPPIPPVRIE